MMEVRRRDRRGKWQLHTIYTIAEANDEQIDHRHWRDAEVGDEGLWFCSDDGYVGQCLSVREYPRKRPTKAHPEVVDRFISLTVGRGVDNKWGKLTFQAPGTVGVKHQFKKRRLIAQLVADFMIKGTPIDWEALGTIWRPTGRPEWKKVNAQRLCSSERMKSMIKDEVSKALASSPWSVDRVLRRYNQLYTKNVKTKPEFAKEILDKMAQFLDMEPDKQNMSIRTSFNMGNVSPSGYLPADADEMDRMAAVSPANPQIAQ